MARKPGAVRNGPGTALMLGALGVVYGDIGTSPLYAFKEAVKAAPPAEPRRRRPPPARCR